MEERDRSRSPSRRTSRVEQVVGRWLRRSRDSSSRERILAEGKAGEASGADQRNYSFRFTVQIQRDPVLHSHGLSLSLQTPILVQEVTPEGPADGRLIPGDQLVKINNVAIEDLTPQQAADIIRECQDMITMTVLRTMVGPKSSFITPEKRAKLRSNPVKVRFAQEVEVNGHSQGNTLLFLPNVLKVYLENGQTKAFKFEPSTTVKDIVMTLKEKLSLSRIEHFSLVLEQQYSLTKMLLLHEEEKIQQIVQRKEAHDFRCLFRVCFMPRDPQQLLQEDPTAFEYLYSQGVNDVLMERLAVEMRCNTALRLAALHIQERMASSGLPPKTSLKILTKSWGIENFVSSTLLRNMREKDLKKAISYHMKKSHAQQDKHKTPSANQTRVAYLQELGELKSYGGKSFSATMMLQDRESMVTLLVGARYGVSQVVNHKLSIMTPLTQFNSITRIELLPESDRVSLVKIYLQDIKPITLLLESVAAKDMSCLIAGYCRVVDDPNINIFPWTENTKTHRVSTEEGYVSRRGSDSDDSSDLDVDTLVSLVSHGNPPRARCASDPHPRKSGKKDRKERDGKRERKRERKNREDTKKKKDVAPSLSPKMEEPDEREGDGGSGTVVQEEEEMTGEGGMQRPVTPGAVREKEGQQGGGGGGRGGAGGEVSEASDSCCTESRVLTSQSSDSLDALEEDDFISCSSSSLHPHSHPLPHPHLLTPPSAHSHPVFHLTIQPPGVERAMSPSPDGRGLGGRIRREDSGSDPHLSPNSAAMTFEPPTHPLADPGGDDNFLCFAELSRMVDYLPSPPEASEEEDEEEEEEEELRRRNEKVGMAWNGGVGKRGASPPPSSSSRLDSVFNFEPSDTRCYYKLCSIATPDSARSLPHPLSLPHGGEGEALELEPIPILQPPPGFGDSSSEDEEFFDARDRFASPEDPTSGAVPRKLSTAMSRELRRSVSLSDIGVCLAQEEREEKEVEEGGAKETVSRLRRRSRKRRSFMETNFTSRVSFPEPDPEQNWDHQTRQNCPTGDSPVLSSDPEPSEQTQKPSPTVSSLAHSEGEPAQLESKPIQGGADYGSPGRRADAGHADRGARDPRALDLRSPVDPSRSARVRQQEMEMEPDAMETKSVGGLVTAACPAITAVRCRVDPDGKENRAVRERINIEVKANGNDDETIVSVGSATNSDGVIDSANSDNVFDDYNVFESAILSSEASRKKDSANANTSSVKANYRLDKMACSSDKADLSLTQTNVDTVQDLSKEPLSPSRFLFQPGAPTVMGRLSASTLRGKIQSLPLYLSRSQETLPKTGKESEVKSPFREVGCHDGKIKITVEDFTDIAVKEVTTATEQMEIVNSDDDSEGTLTGSEAGEGEVVVETSRAEITRSTVSEVEEVVEKVVMVYGSPSLPVRAEPKPEPRTLPLSPGPVIQPPCPIMDAADPGVDIPGSIKATVRFKMATVETPVAPTIEPLGIKRDVPPRKMESPTCAPPIVVTTQSLNGPGLHPYHQGATPARNSSQRPLTGLCGSGVSLEPEQVKPDPSSCGVFTVCEDQPHAQPLPGSGPATKPDFGCSSLLSSGCDSAVDGVQAPLDACGCPSSAYTNCFSGGGADSFDDELTVYEFSCRTQSAEGLGQTSGAGGLPLVGTPPTPSFLSTSPPVFSPSSLSPSFPRSVLFARPSCSLELSPLLSPLSESVADDDGCFLSEARENVMAGLRRQRYPPPPEGFLTLRRDLDALLSLLEGGGAERALGGRGGRHPPDTCPAHFSENKRVLHAEARRLMAGCQRVVAAGQSSEDMLLSLADGFRTLVELAGVCLWFSGCQRCDRRNGEAVSGMADVARSFREFCLAAERASGRRSCQDLSTKLLAKQCTALTASVFCLTQVFRTLTAL
ncbi:FERM and PDZ domain-containing protein 1 [Aplochiton taeniatus]